MGDMNQLKFLKKFLPQVDGPILEVGSRDYGNTASFRDFYPQNEYLGVDLSEGKNVDVVLDMTKGTGTLPTNHYGLAICCSVLEHVKRPWVMAENITNLIRPDGWLYVSVPWVWRFHAYPDDYFRFSYRGLKELFPDYEWQQMYYSTYIRYEFYEINEQNQNIDDELAIMLKLPEGERKYLPYLMVHMLGQKRVRSMRRAA